jgi:signal transduction histidine kinase
MMSEFLANMSHEIRTPLTRRRAHQHPKREQLMAVQRQLVLGASRGAR